MRAVSHSPRCLPIALAVSPHPSFASDSFPEASIQGSNYVLRARGLEKDTCGVGEGWEKVEKE